VLQLVYTRYSTYMYVPTMYVLLRSCSATNSKKRAQVRDEAIALVDTCILDKQLQGLVISVTVCDSELVQRALTSRSAPAL
jgi:hypothetical protein